MVSPSTQCTLVVAMLRAKLRPAATLDFPTPVSGEILMTTGFTVAVKAHNQCMVLIFDPVPPCMTLHACYSVLMNQKFGISLLSHHSIIIHDGQL